MSQVTKIRIGLLRKILWLSLQRNSFEWAAANRYLYQILAGKIDVLDEYVEYLSARENEILRGMFKLIKAANTHNMNIDYVLERFKMKISSHMFIQDRVGSYTDQIIDDRFAIF